MIALLDTLFNIRYTEHFQLVIGELKSCAFDQHCYQVCSGRLSVDRIDSNTPLRFQVCRSECVL